MTEAEREALIEAGRYEYALQAIAQRLSEHLGRIVDTADVVLAVDELIDENKRLAREVDRLMWRVEKPDDAGHDIIEGCMDATLGGYDT